MQSTQRTTSENIVDRSGKALLVFCAASRCTRVLARLVVRPPCRSSGCGTVSPLAQHFGACNGNIWSGVGSGITPPTEPSPASVAPVLTTRLADEALSRPLLCLLCMTVLLRFSEMGIKSSSYNDNSAWSECCGGKAEIGGGKQLS